MARASVILKCSLCGEDYRVQRVFRTRTDAEDWERYKKRVGGGVCNVCRMVRWDEEKNQKICNKQAEKVETILNYLSSVPEQIETRSVKKTVSIPAWLDNEAKRVNAPFSQILQEGLKEYLQNKKTKAAQSGPSLQVSVLIHALRRHLKYRQASKKT